MVGFPGHDTVSWPALGESASATYRHGAIARATDFANNANAKPQELQYLQHTMANWFGFSGSPIFLRNGNVVALNNSGKSVQKDGLATSLAFGVRVDCLWELLAYHELTDLISFPVPKEQLGLARFESEDPGLKQHAQVLEYVNRGRRLFEERRYAEAGDAFHEAVTLAPNCAAAHQWKAANHNEYVLNHNYLSREQKLSQQQKAVYHREKALALEPANSWNLANLVNAQASYAEYRDGFVPHPELRAVCRRILELPDLESSLRSNIYITLGITYGQASERLPFYSLAVKTNPYNAAAYESRARSYRVVGDYGAATADQNYGDRLRKANVDNLRAWDLIKSDTELDHQEAVRLATSACQTTNYKHWPFLETLAVSHYVAEDYRSALRRIQECYDLCPESSKADISVKLRIYQDLAAKANE
jgi:tetratricopeptide (TPR) repeat protein